MSVSVIVRLALSAPNIIFHVVDDLGWNDLGYQADALPGQTNAISSRMQHSATTF